MNGVVLLDPEQQRSLRSSPSPYFHSSGTTATTATTTTSSYRGRSQASSTSNPSIKQTNARTDFTTANHSPRTNFSTASARSGDVHPQHRGHDANSMGGYPLLHYPSEEGDGEEEDSAYQRDDYPTTARSSSQGGPSAAGYAGTTSGLHISVRLILLGLVVGLALGVTMDELHVSRLATEWVGLPGELFLRALNCLVIPYVFCAVAVALGDIVFVGKVSVVGLQTARVFAIFWVATTVLGMVVAVLARPSFRASAPTTTNTANAVSFTCWDDSVLTLVSNGSLVCTKANTTDSSNANADADGNANTPPFQVVDVTNAFVKTDASNLAAAQPSLSDHLQATIRAIVSSNLIASMASGTLLEVITFAMVLGTVAGRAYFTHTRRINYLYLTLLQLRNAFFLALEWVIWLSPVAVLSYVAAAYAQTGGEGIHQFTQFYSYVVAGYVAALLHVLVLLPFLVFLLTRCNPFTLMAQMTRSYVFAFACSSSLATAPITLASIRKARVCSQSLANFVISLGVCSNVSGVGFYFPIAVVFLAESSGRGEELTVLRLTAIFALSLVSCAGTPPIPAAGLVTISTIYTTVMATNELPDTFSYVVAMDFFLDRIVTLCNVNDDIMALKVIAENTDETVTQEHLGARD